MGLRSFTKQLLILLVASNALGAITGTDCGTGSNSTSEASTLTAPTTTIHVGATGILSFTGQNAAGAGASNVPATITDSVGNLWVRATNQISSGSANLGVEQAFYVATNLTTQLTSSNNVPITYTVGPVTGKCWSFIEAAPGAGNIVIWNSSSNGGQGAGQTTVSGGMAASITTGHMVAASAGLKSGGTFTPDSDTTNGSWSTQQFVAAGTNNSQTSQWKVVTSSGVQTYDLAFSTTFAAWSIIRLSEVPSNMRLAAGSTTGTTSFVINPAIKLSAGNTAALVIACDNAGNLGATAAAPTSITDSVGNVWTQQLDAFYDNGAASAGAELAFYTAPITTNLTVTDNITVTWIAGVSVVAKAAFIYEFTGAYTYVASGSSSPGSTTGTPTVTSSSIPSGDVIIGGGAAEGADTWVADTDTSNGSWSLMASENGGAPGLTAMAGTTQYKIVTGTAAQTYNPTLTSADVIIGWMELNPPVSGLTAAQKAAFFQMFP